MIHFPDLINGIFEAGIGLLQVQNVRFLRQCREIRGVHWGLTAWVSFYGLYNLYFYPSLHLWISFAGGVFIFLANLIWLFHALYYEGDISWRPPFVPPKREKFSTTTLLTDPFPKTQLPILNKSHF